MLSVNPIFSFSISSILWWVYFRSEPDRSRWAESMPHAFLLRNLTHLLCLFSALVFLASFCGDITCCLPATYTRGLCYEQFYLLRAGQNLRQTCLEWSLLEDPFAFKIFVQELLSLSSQADLIFIKWEILQFESWKVVPFSPHRLGCTHATHRCASWTEVFKQVHNSW